MPIDKRVFNHRPLKYPENGPKTVRVRGRLSAPAFEVFKKVGGFDYFEEQARLQPAPPPAPPSPHPDPPDPDLLR